jgi:hypothetical protein
MAYRIGAIELLHSWAWNCPGERKAHNQAWHHAMTDEHKGILRSRVQPALEAFVYEPGSVW